jgi:hypothetical protein
MKNLLMLPLLCFVTALFLGFAAGHDLVVVVSLLMCCACVGMYVVLPEGSL